MCCNNMRRWDRSCCNRERENTCAFPERENSCGCGERENSCRKTGTICGIMPVRLDYTMMPAGRPIFRAPGDITLEGGLDQGNFFGNFG